MKLSYLRRGGKHLAKKSASLSLLTVLVASTLLGAVVTTTASGTALADPPKHICNDGSTKYGDSARACEANGGLKGQTPEDMSAQGLLRRQLHTFAQCITDDYIYTGDHTINKYNDIFDTNPATGTGSSDSDRYRNYKETIVVGLDRSAKGVVNCNDAIKDGIKAFKQVGYPTGVSGQEKNWLLTQLTGKNLDDNSGGSYKAKDILKRVNNLHGQIVSAENNIAKASNKMIQARAFPLALMCYDIKSSADVAVKNNDQSFKYKDSYYYLKSSEEVQREFLKAGFIKKADTGFITKPSVKFGDLDLEFTDVRGSTNDFNVGSNDFYPIGSDITATKDYKFSAVVDCGFTYKFKSIVLDGVTAGSGGKLVPPDDLPNTGLVGDGGGTPTGCQIQGALGWIANPICDAAREGIDKMSGVLEDALTITPLVQTGASAGAYIAWKAFRDLANVFFVLIFLIVIFAQVLPFEIDAYTIKKLLPKLIVAVVAVQFSYFICTVLVDISNVLGAGVKVLFEGVIKQINSLGGTIPTSGSATNLASGITAGVLGGVATLFLIGPVLMLLLAGFIAVATTVLTVEARQLILIFLVIISPIAFIAAVLPNTDSYYKKWGSNFIKLLLMYPLIQGIISGSVMIQGVMNSAFASGGTGSSMSEIQQVFVNFVPVIAFFMIPATLKASGAITGAIASSGFGRAKSMSGRAGAAAKQSLNERRNERGAALMASTSMGKRTVGRVLSGNALSFGDKGQRKIRAAINKNYGEISETAQDKYQEMSNAKRFEEFKKLKTSNSSKDQLEATALGNMIAANGGGPEMAKYFDSLEGYEFNEDGSYKRDSGGNLVNNLKSNPNADGTFTRGKVTRDKNGAVVSVKDNAWKEIAKRNGSFLATAVPHSVSKPASQAGAGALIGAKGSGFGAQLKAQALDMQAKGDAVGLQKLANQFVAAAQREDAVDMQGGTISAFQDLATAGVFSGSNISFKGDVAGSPVTTVADFIHRTTIGGSLQRTIQG